MLKSNWFQFTKVYSVADCNMPCNSQCI